MKARFFADKKFASLPSLALALLFLFPLLSCGKSDSNETRKPVSAGSSVKAQAVVLFTVGNVMVDKKHASVGDIIQDGTWISVGRRATCDLQMRSTESSVVIRLTDNSKLRFDARKMGEKTGVSLNLEQGRALASIEKLSSNEEIRVVTPAAVASVRGTKFETNVKASGETTTIVVDGKVATRVRIKEVEELPPAVIANSKVLTNVVNNLEEKEVVLEPGKKVTIHAQSGDRLLNEMHGVKEALASDEVMKSKNEKLSETELAAIGNSVDQKVKDESEVKSAISGSKEIQLESKSVTDPEMKRKRKEYNELIQLNQESMRDDTKVAYAARKRNTENEKQLQKRIETIFNKSSETLILKEGQKIYGVVYQVGQDYEVMTVNGKVLIKGSEVSGFAF